MLKKECGNHINLHNNDVTFYTFKNINLNNKTRVINIFRVTQTFKLYSYVSSC